MAKLLAGAADRLLRRFGVPEAQAGACIGPDCECFYKNYQIWKCCYDCHGNYYCIGGQTTLSCHPLG